MTAGTPRVARFEDLRVGQWVAWLYTSEFATRARAGQVVGKGDSSDTFEVREKQGRSFFVGEPSCGDGLVTILRDAPEPPVKVRREDYDALVEWLKASDNRGFPESDLGYRVRVLIDNADTGDDQ